eukprot:5347095-Pyramimonas_sp.AAC.1
MCIRDRPSPLTRPGHALLGPRLSVSPGPPVPLLPVFTRVAAIGCASLPSSTRAVVLIAPVGFPPTVPRLRACPEVVTPSTQQGAPDGALAGGPWRLAS